jgi:hypothetical protein
MNSFITVNTCWLYNFLTKEYKVNQNPRVDLLIKLFSSLPSSQQEDLLRELKEKK